MEFFLVQESEVEVGAVFAPQTCPGYTCKRKDLKTKRRI